MPAVTVVGSINRDIVAFVPHIPAPGETVLGTGSAMYPGGKGANQAVAAVRLRADVATPVRMIGRVGRDAFGDDMRGFLAGEGIDVSGVKAVDGVGTGLALINVDANAENAITVISGANMIWPDGVGTLAVAARDVVVCQLEVPLEVVTATFAVAKAARATTLLNPAPYRPMPPALLALTDVLVLNEVELVQMLGREPAAIMVGNGVIAAAREVLAHGPGAVIVTLGPAGVLVIEKGGRAERILGRAVTAVDTTGAGDCFVGALAAELARDDDLLLAAHFANAAAAISVTQAGAASSMPRRNQVALSR